MTSIYYITAVSLIGGWLSRMAGGGWPKLPLGLDQWLYAVPYLCLSLCATYTASAPVAVICCVSVLVLILTMLAKRTGHGTAMDLGASDEKETEPERLEFLWSWMPRGYWHDFVGLAILGLVVAVPAACVLAFINHWCALILLAGGAAKAQAYAAGWKFAKPKSATAWGEFLTGVFGWGSVALCYMILFEH